MRSAIRSLIRGLSPRLAGKAISLRSLAKAVGGLSDDQGTALVELAAVIPVTMLMLTGILSFGVYINKNLELTNATSIAGQYMSLTRSTTQAADPCSTFVTNFESVAPLLQSSSLGFSFNLNGTSYANTTTCTAGSAQMTTGATAQITVTYPCTLAVWGINLIPGCTLTSKVTEIIQ